MAELFPSGPWIGFYTYASPQDKHRQDFQLSFENGRMDGSGSDDIGFFTLRGTYNEDSLETKWLKTYPGSHDVDYRGFREGKGIYGQWTQASNLDRPNAGGSQSARPATGGNQTARPSQPTVDRNRPSTNEYRPSNRPSTQPSYSNRSGGSRQPATRPQLERDYSARRQGAQRASNFQRHSAGRRR